ncbi:hypothetical protein BGX26_006134 [Mortierella sp. AD094]|nr:hypothetical protein BGX26_006134 [Mortierella sp. AD094]
MQRFSCPPPPSSSSSLLRSLTRVSSSGSAGVVRSKAITASVLWRNVNTNKPLYFSTSTSHARQDDNKKAGSNDMLDEIGVSMHNKSKPTIITAAGIDPSPLSASAASVAAAEGNKVFTVRPITSWIDKLAQMHGSPTSGNNNTVADPTKKYEKRDLLLKTMQDSYTEIILPFAKDKALLEEYINFGGHIRHGKIMEDLDALAGAISYKHCDDGKTNSQPIIIVTAAVDRIDFLNPFGVRDLRLSGNVTYVGYSSMEVFMKMEEVSEKPGESGDTILAARFTTVARYALTHKAAQVNPMRLRNDAEKKIFQTSEDHKTRKRLAAESALTKRPPTEDERFLIHDLYLEYSKYVDSKATKPDDVEWMSDTKMSSIQIMQPQDRNIHDKIFGGYLMRLAYELAFCNTSVFLKCRPKFLALDEISFRAPVNIGTFLALDSQIVYSDGVEEEGEGGKGGGEHHTLQVRVKADVLNITKNTRETTNTFWFTFEDPRQPQQGHRRTPKVLPRTYAESMLYIEGMRRRNEGAKLSKINRANLGL